MRLSLARATASGVRTRARGEDGIGQPCPDPLVDERGREAGRYGHRRCPSTTPDRPPEDDAHAAQLEQGPRAEVVLVHGFTQSSASWGRIADDLAAHFEVVTVDLPGHGRSPVPAPGSDMAEAAGALGRRGRQGRLRRLLAGRPVLPPPGPPGSPIWSSASSSSGRIPGSPEETERRLRREADESARRRARAGRRRGCAGVHRHLARRTALRPPDEGAGRPALAARQLGRRPGRLAADRGHRRRRRRHGTGSAISQMPVLVVVGARRRQVQAPRRADGAGHRPECAAGRRRRGRPCRLLRAPRGLRRPV